LPLSGGTLTGNVTVQGSVSSNSIVYASGGNSNNWNNVYTTYQSQSGALFNSASVTSQGTVRLLTQNLVTWDLDTGLQTIDAPTFAGLTLTGAMSTNQDIEITDVTKGIILKSPGGTKYRITVTNAGELVTTLV
jgi:hypothetical protein